MNDRPLDISIHAGPPCDPIPFDNISYNRGRRGTAIVRNPSNGEQFAAENVLFQCNDIPTSSMNEQIHSNVTNAYWKIPEKKQKNTIWGCVQFCYVLRRNPADENEHGEVIFNLTLEVVAVKMFVWANVRANQHAHESPMNEIASMLLLGNDHPNVVGCHEVLFDGVCLNAVLQYCNGGDLHDRLYQVNLKRGSERRIGLSEDEARYWFVHLLEGISHLQIHGICHRDLSPENVMLVQSDANGDRSLIIDMGMCLKLPYSADDGTDRVTHYADGSIPRLIKPQGMYGKRKYMAPEIFRNGVFDGFSVDIWAAGTVLFFMLTGCTYEIPSHEDLVYQLLIQNTGELIRRLITSRIISQSVCISVEAIDLLQNIFREDPRDRYTLSEIFQHPWIHDYR